MKKRTLVHILFWLVILAFLTIYFGAQWKSRILAFYFSSMLLPIVVGTTYYFNLRLVPKYFLTGRFSHFGLYFFYLLVISLYAEMMVALLSFVILANYQADVMNLGSLSIFNLGLTLYAIVFGTSFIRMGIQFRQHSALIEELKEEAEKKAVGTLQFKSDRKNVQIAFSDLLYLESLNEQVRVVSVDGDWTTREKITHLHDRLSDDFLRIHRSFVVNKHKVSSFSRTEIQVGDIELPIGRTYKKEVVEELEG